MNAAQSAATLLNQNLRSARRVAARLERLASKVTPLFPIETGEIDSLSDDDMDRVDAMLKRFEQLQNTLGDTVFRGIALVEGYDIAPMTKRDISDLMERIGVLRSSQRWFDLTLLRNRLAHAYPEESAAQARRVNDAFNSIPELLATEAAARAYAEQKGRISPDQT